MRTMLKAAACALCVLSAAGCAQAPILEGSVPEKDLAECRSLAEQRSVAQRAIERGAIESARAAGVAAGIAKIAEAAGTSVSLPLIALGYAVTGALGGVIEAHDNRARIVRECLRDRGHRAY